MTIQTGLGLFCDLSYLVLNGQYPTTLKNNSLLFCSYLMDVLWFPLQPMAASFVHWMLLLMKKAKKILDKTEDKKRALQVIEIPFQGIRRKSHVTGVQK